MLKKTIVIISIKCFRCYSRYWGYCYIQYFLIINDTDLELLNDQLLPLGITPPPILHKQAIRQISNKQ